MDDSVSLRIVTEIADREEVDPTELTPRLHDVINPDALEAIFESPAPSNDEPEVTVTFVYHDYEVVVDSTGSLEIGPVSPDTKTENGSP